MHHLCGPKCQLHQKVGRNYENWALDNADEFVKTFEIHYPTNYVDLQNKILSFFHHLLSSYVRAYSLQDKINSYLTPYSAQDEKKKLQIFNYETNDKSLIHLDAH